ncbi:hypothetical protein [Burkholderia sp. RS02]|uniref:hypothetical protein n=1 Tax=unclassified Burkholderia TaxID=2613784 RepID=UPI003218AB66
MTFIADPVRMRLDDAGIAVVSKLKNSHMADGLDELLVEAHECPRRSSRFGYGIGNSTAGADSHLKDGGSDVMLHTNVIDKVIKVYPVFREFHGMGDVIKHVAATTENRENLTRTRPCAASFLASKAVLTGLRARMAVVLAGFGPSTP